MELGIGSDDSHGTSEACLGSFGAWMRILRARAIEKHGALVVFQFEPLERDG